jgi:hypothetical protein
MSDRFDVEKRLHNAARAHPEAAADALFDALMALRDAANAAGDVPF